MRGITPVIGIVLILLVLVSLVSSAWYYLFSQVSGRTSKVIQTVPGSESCEDLNVDVVVKNIGIEGIEIPLPTADFQDMRNIIENSGFDIDEDGDGIPDGWFVTQPSDIVLVTDLSNSMNTCMDNESEYEHGPDPHMMLYLKMNENLSELHYINDSSGNENQCFGSSWMDCTVEGKYNFGCLFNPETGDVAFCSNSESLNSPEVSQEITISLWTTVGYIEDEQDWAMFVIKGNGQGNPREYSFGISSTGYLHFAFHNPQYGWNPCTDTQLSIENDHVWHHVTVTYNKSVIQFYVDGVPRDSCELAAAMVSNTNQVWVGQTTNGEWKFNGSMDELIMWNRTLTPEEIKVLAENPPIFQESCPSDGDYQPLACRHQFDSECPSDCALWKAEREERYCVEDFELNLNTSFVHYEENHSTELVNCEYYVDEGNCNSGSYFCGTLGKVYNGSSVYGGGYGIDEDCNQGDCSLGGNTSVGSCEPHNRTACDNVVSCSGEYLYRMWGTSCYPSCTTEYVRDACFPTECNISYQGCTNMTRVDCAEPLCGGLHHTGMYYGPDDWKAPPCISVAGECWTGEERYAEYQCVEEHCSSLGASWVEVNGSECELSCGGSYPVCCRNLDSFQHNCPGIFDNCCSLQTCRQQYDRCCTHQTCQHRLHGCCDEMESGLTEFCAVLETVNQSAACTPGYSSGLPDPANMCLGDTEETYLCVQRRACYVCDVIKVGLAKNVSKGFIENVMINSTRVALVSYGSTSSIDAGLTNDSEELLGFVNGYQPNKGQTCIACAIDDIIELLRDVESRKFAVLMSDGDANRCTWGACSATEARNEVWSKAFFAREQHGITIYAIGFGSEAGQETLEGIASRTGGEFFQGNNPEEIEDIYAHLAQELGGGLDKGAKVYGDYSLQLIAGVHSRVVSGFLPINPINYSLSYYLRSDIEPGTNLLVDLEFYNEFEDLLETRNAGTFAGDINDFAHQEFLFDANEIAGAAYIKIVFHWEDSPPTGSAWIDDMFLGPPLPCERLSARRYKCGELTITKTKGDGDLIPFFSSEDLGIREAVIFRDANCVNQECEYRITAAANTVTVKPQCS